MPISLIASLSGTAGVKIGIVFASLGAAIGVAGDFLRDLRRQKEIENRTKAIEAEADAQPDKVKFAWDLARVKLEAYFDRNLSQVKSIFWVSVGVMIVGFGLVSYGVVIGLSHPEGKAAYVSAVSGILTEFIGATFMLIYRSTMAQANSFMAILERINTVGMAVQILDTISDGEVQLKNQTRSEIVKLLLMTARDHPES